MMPFKGSTPPIVAGFDIQVLLFSFFFGAEVDGAEFIFGIFCDRAERTESGAF
jgi:hypothetical protein|tara:strand:- start:3454 stop:3612 length:159 start_codon:yes stop_codon:yes gene_type:complete